MNIQNVKGAHMKMYQGVAMVLSVLFSLTASAQNQQASFVARIDPLPRDLEMQLALSALPRHLRGNATAYILNPAKGFEIAQKGTNGFHAFVARTGDDTFRGSWPFTAYRDDILYPISFDEAGAKANMRVFFDAAEMQAKATPPRELKQIIQERFKTHYYKPPERAGVSYMMAPVLRTYTNPDENDGVHTAITPHVMHYTPNVSSEAVGAATPAPDELRPVTKHGRWQNTPDPFVILHGPHGYMVQFLGVTETAAIGKEYEVMLGRLCKIKKVWCLPQ
jgi:hypothetical protein